MATSDTEDIDVQFGMDMDHYSLLGVNHNATEREIIKAYREKALLYHPDKNPNTSEEIMKLLNTAYSVLSDKIKRADYNEKLEEEGPSGQSDPIASLITGPRPSEEFKIKFEQWLKTKTDPGIGKFTTSLKENLIEFMKGPFKHLAGKSQNVSEHSPEDSLQSSTYNELLNSVVDTMNNSKLVDATTQSEKSLQKVIERMRTATNTSQCKTSAAMPILDFSCANDRELRILLAQFIPANRYDTLEEMKRDELLERISKFVPCATVNKPPEQNESNNCCRCQHNFRALLNPRHFCASCGSCFCKKCLPFKVKLPRLGILKSQQICEVCYTSNAQLDESDWVSHGLQHLKPGTLEAMWPAFGCFTMAINFGTKHVETMTRLANELMSMGLFEMVLPILVTVLQEVKSPKEKIKSHLVMASVGMLLANEPEISWEDKACFIDFAKEACLSATLNSSVEATVIGKKQLEIDLAMKSFHQELQLKHSQYTMETKLALEVAWDKRDFEDLLSIITDERDEEFIELVGKDSITEALCNFITERESFFDRMTPEDRFSLLFLRGVLKFQQGFIEEGLSDIETAAWSGSNAKWLSSATVGALLGQITSDEESSLYPQKKSSACKQLVEYIQQVLVDQKTPNNASKPLLLPAKEILNPANHKLHWPDLYIEGKNMKALQKYEKAVIENVKNGKWSEYDAALSYIDLYQACTHPAEIALCFLTAATWFYQALSNPQNKKVNTKGAEKYAFKNAILHCIRIADIIARLHLHPGMQFFVADKALLLTVETIKQAGRLATPEDSKLLIGLLHSVIYNCRFCPFWNHPAVSVSEAVLFNILSGQLHTEYILGLQYIDPTLIPLNTSELHYQIYESDLCHLSQLENSAGAHSKAMEEMMKEKGLAWDDVAAAMTSPLTPHDSDGWLICQSNLGNSPEYSELKGFVFNTDAKKHSIEILADTSSTRKHRVGLFSQSDINTILQISLSDIYPMFFSLDQPNPDQHYHPFQKMTYMPETLAGTEILYTLFHTDYLLKSFSVGSEVSSNPPFLQRPSSDGLTADLPPHLQKILTPLTDRGRTSNNIHRFWIQADELIYDVNQVGSKIEYRLGEPRMVIRSHPLIPGLDGELQDTENSEDPDSPEATFAADLTKHYSELEQFFPMFARLKELCKLQFLCVAINITLSGMKEKAEGKGWEVTDEMLNNIHTTTRQSQKSNLKNVLRKIRQKIPSEHRTNSSVVSEIVNSLMGVCKSNVQRSTMNYHVTQWLRNGRDNDLVDLISSTLPLPTRSEIRQVLIDKFQTEFDAFKSEVNELQESARRLALETNRNNCNWVPAAMLKRETKKGTSYSLCYGGVILSPKLHMGYVPNTLKGTTRTRIEVKPPSRLIKIFGSIWPGSKTKTCSSSFSAPIDPASSRGGSRCSDQQWNNGSKRNSNTFKFYGNVIWMSIAGAALVRDRKDRKKPNHTTQRQLPLEVCRNSLKEKQKSPEGTFACGHQQCKCCAAVTGSNTIKSTVTGKNVVLPNREFSCRSRRVIYLITDRQAPHMQYVGMTTQQLNKRLTGHRNNKRSAVYRHFQGRFEKDAQVTIIHQLPDTPNVRERLLEKEKELIKEIDPQLNVAK